MTLIDSEYLAPPNAPLRLSDAEREAAVDALQRNAADGRLSGAELAERSDEARRAVTRGDLAALFVDLPLQSAPAPAPVDEWDTPFPPDGSDRPRSWAALLTALSPFVAVALFFITGTILGFAYAWLWFLLVPVTAIVLFVGRPGPR
jgi:Domain of unknown function (DUF1707)